MFVLKIATTVWLTLIALGMTSATLNEKETVSTRLISIAIMFGQILAIAFMWQYIGHSPSGKAQHFDCCIRWFKSNMPCSGFTWFPDIGLSSSFHPHSGKLLRAVTRLVRV